MSELPSSRPSAPSPRGWGFLVALCVFVGAIGGSWLGQPSIGFLGGLALGGLLALALWLLERR